MPRADCKPNRSHRHLIFANHHQKEMSSGSPTTTYSMSSYETTVPVSTGSTTIEMAFSVVQIYVPKEVSSSTSTEITTSTSLGTDASVMFSTSGTKLIPTATSAILHSSEVTMATAVATHPANNALKAAAGSASLGTVMLTAWIVALLR